MKLLLSVIVLLAILLVGAEARLGETKEQLEERYGKAGKEKDEGNIKFLVFDKDSFKITCYLRQNCVCIVSYSKKEQWTDDEIKQILNKNTNQGVEWKKIENSVNKFYYKTTDGARAAIYSILKKDLTILFQSEVQNLFDEKQKEIDAI